jgi:acid phosphatase type 7
MLMVAQALVVVSALLAAAAAATAAEYVRPPPGRIILTEHTEPAAHPQQVHTLHYTFLFTTDATVLYVTRLIKLRSMSTDPVYSQVHVSAVGEKHVRVSWVTDDMRAQSVVDYGKASRNYTASATGEHTSYRWSPAPCTTTGAARQGRSSASGPRRPRCLSSSPSSVRT